MPLVGTLFACFCALDKTIIYEYNGVGNITSVKTYGYTTAATPSGTYTEQTYGYDATQTDRLTSFGGTSIGYNSIGCPITYQGKSLTWTKGKLTRMSSGSRTTGMRSYNFTYNALGQRVGKSYSYLEGTSSLNPIPDGEVTSYTKVYHYDHLGKLIAETISSIINGTGSVSSEIVYIYDGNSVIGMHYTSLDETNTYYFRRNLQGDVVGIYDTIGNLKVKYLYDAWGNCTVASETTDLALAKANPIRYRGYYYDEDTKLYCLNARYYSPEWRRFISPDDTAYLDSETPNGLNLYAYCNNDPVNFADPSGHEIITAILIGAAIGAIVGFGGTALVDYYDDGEVFNGSIGVRGYIANTLVGAAIGSLIGGIGFSTFSLKLPTFELLQMATVNGSAQTVVIVGSTTITLDGTVVLGVAVAGLGIAFFSKPNSGRIRFSDGTGIDPATGKPVTDPDRAYKIYRSLKDPIKKANWKKWMKGKGWRTNHLK